MKLFYNIRLAETTEDPFSYVLERNMLFVSWSLIEIKSFAVSEVLRECPPDLGAEELKDLAPF